MTRCQPPGWSTSWTEVTGAAGPGAGPVAQAIPWTRRSRALSPAGVRLQATLLALAAAAGVSGMATYAAFTDTTQSSANQVSSGRVTLEDNDGDEAMLTLVGARPGDGAEGCILVSYTGTLAATVRLTGAVSGDLSEHVTLVVTRGVGDATGFPSCQDFAADPHDYVGAGDGVLYEGPLSDFPASYSQGLVDPGDWTTSDEQVYRFQVTVDEVDPALVQGRSVTVDFTWHSRWSGP